MTQTMTDQADPNFSAIPPPLAQRRQWLLWRFEPGEKKPKKMPYYTNGRRRTGGQGSDADRAALVDLAGAQAAFEKSKGKYTGVGFAFLPGDNLIGVDLDGMINPETGEVSDRARNIIAACASYTEYSPSGKGVHIICSGETETFKSNEVGVEVFQGRQYFTFTGNRYPDTPHEVNALPAKVLKRLKATVESGKKRADGKPSTAPPPALEGRAKIESALAYISPDLGYNDWIAIGMAIYAELGQGAFDVWDSWSAKSAKYPGAKQLDQHWKSFKPDAGSGPLFKKAMDAGWSPPKRKRLRAQPPPDAGPPPDDAPPVGEKQKTRTKAGAGKEKKGSYIKDLIWGRDGLKNCLSNVYQIMAQLPEWRGVIAWDEFSLAVVKRKPPPYAGGAIGEWTATDDSLAAMWLAIREPDWNFTPSSDLIAEAVEVLARANPFHPVREYLRSLKWDGTDRLAYWLSDLLGAPKNDYTSRVGAWYLMGAVKRVLQPGCKFDYCIVLCGNQGKKKSSILDALAAEWFGDTDLDLGHKDSMSALRGKWIYEIAELGALARTEERRQKSFLSRRIDEYRPVYGRREIKAPRQLVFSGTTNEHEWNKDPTGGRRFWPIDVLVDEIDLDALRAIRDQLWAEALRRIDAGERYWPTLEEQTKFFDPEQLKIEQQDSLVDALHDWVYEQPKVFSLYEAAVALKIDASKITRDLQTRLGVALRKLGCKRVEKRNGMTRFWYEPPKKEGDSDTATKHAQLQGGVNAPF